MAPDLPSLSFPGPGTAALFGAALVFFALAWTQKDMAWPAFAGGVGLLIIGFAIEYQKEIVALLRSTRRKRS